MAQAAAPRRVVHFGVFEVDFGTGELRKAGLKIKLQDQPFRVLAMLLERPGDLVTREELHSRLWPSDTFVDFDHGLNVAVKKLRRALSDSADSPRFIETLARRGYRFIAPVENLDTAAEKSPRHGETHTSTATGAAVLPTHAIQRKRLRWLVAAVLAVVAGFALWSRWPANPASRVVTRFTISLPVTERFAMGRGGLAISPDGAYLVYSAATWKTGKRQLYLRPMNRNETISIPGTDDATGPFFSPDGQWIAFNDGSQLKKVLLRGGSAITLCEAPHSSTGSWGPDGTIFFAVGSGLGAEGKGKLMQVPATGGTPQVVVPADKTLRELGPRWPEVLPAGDAILYVAEGTSAAFSDDATIVAQSLKTGDRRVLIHGGTSPRYLSTGHIVYAQGGRLLAVPFDPQRLELTGAATPVAEDVWQGPAGYAAYAVSRDGSLVSLSRGEGNTLNRTLNWVDRTGALRPISATARQYNQPSLSPDGKQLALAIGDPLRQADIWIMDLERNTITQLTFSKTGETALAPLWTPDGKRLIYAAGAHATSLFWQAAGGSGAAEPLFTSDAMTLPTSVSPDGSLLIFQRGDVRHWDLWVLRLSGKREARPLLEGPSWRAHAQISPDGRWLAYTSEESGFPEVYVQPFPGLGGKWLISREGGEEPQWSRDGRQLFYRRSDKMVVVDIQSKVAKAFKAGRPHLLFEGPYGGRGFPDRARSFLRSYDTALDGQRFLMLKEEDEAQANQVLRVVLNWTDELKSRVHADTK